MIYNNIYTYIEFMMNKIIIIDDNKDFARSVYQYFKRKGFTVYISYDPSMAVTMISEIKPDLIISDVKMPMIDGMTLLSIVRNNKETKRIPFILISGEEIDENSQVMGYEKGVDDYIMKPFSFKILEAKIKRILSYCSKKDFYEGSVLEYPPIKLDEMKKEVYVGDKKVNLTRKEYEILLTLLKNPGRVFSHNYFLQNVWGYDLSVYNDKHTVEVHFSSLRKKLGIAGKKIKNIAGFGYKLD